MDQGRDRPWLARPYLSVLWCSVCVREKAGLRQRVRGRLPLVLQRRPERHPRSRAARRVCEQDGTHGRQVQASLEGWLGPRGSLAVTVRSFGLAAPTWPRRQARTPRVFFPSVFLAADAYAVPASRVRSRSESPASITDMTEQR